MAASAQTGGANYVSTNNSSTSVLGIGGTFTGTSEDVTIFKSVVINVYTDQSSAANGLSVQFSSNGTNWDFVTGNTVTGNTGFSKTFQVLASRFRLVYTNGSVAQTFFRLQTILVVAQDSNSTSYPTSNITSTPTTITGPTDSFGDIATTSKEPSVISSFQYNINAASVVTTLTGSASASSVNAMARLSTGTTTGSTSSIRSVNLTQYTSGTGVRVYLTGVFASGVANTSQWIGAGNTDNGYFFGYNGTSFSIRHLNNASNTYIAQTSWNVDVMNGSGPSGITLNPQTGNVYIIKIQWLGFGCISFYIENPQTSLPTLVHVIRYPNTATVPSLNKTGFYSLASSSNGTTTTNIILDVSCIALYLEGNVLSRAGNKFSSYGSTSTTTGVLQSIVSIRVRSTFAGVTNFVPILIDLVSISSEGNKPVRFEVIREPTNTFTWTNVNTNQSVVEFSNTVATITTGTNTNTLYTFFLGKTDSQTNNLTDDRFFVPPGITVTVAALTTNATNENSASLSWREFF